MYPVSKNNMNWPVKKIGAVADILGGYAFKSAQLKKERINEDYLPVIKIGSLLATGILEGVDLQFHKFVPELSKYLIRENDILVAMTGATVGKVAISNKNNLLLNQRVGLVRAKETLSQQDFLKYLLLSNSFYKYCQSTSGGGAQGNISPSQIMNYVITIPPVKSQKEIVERLDIIRKAQEFCGQQIQKTEELFESILYSQFNLSEGSSIKKISDVAEVTSSKRIFKKDYVNQGVPFFRTKEIVELSDNKPISLELFISKEQFEEITKKFGIPQAGDILISAVGTIGISWVVPDSRRFYFKDGNLLWIKNFRGVKPLYLKYLLDFNFTSVSKLAAGGAYKALTIVNLKKFKIPVVTLREQQKIVEKLGVVQDYKKLLQKQKLLFKELFDSVLDKSMKGEMDN